MRRIQFIALPLVLAAFSCSEEKASDPDSGIKPEMDAGIDASGDADGDTDTDTDTDSDADADADVDSGTDSGPDVIKSCVGGSGGISECEVDGDCPHGQWLVCPGLMGEEAEVTSYCYASCDFDAGHAEGTSCVPRMDGNDEGVCLDTAYLESDWAAKWEGHYFDSPDNPVHLSVGSIDIEFTTSIIWRFDDEEHGVLAAILYVASSNTSQWQLQVTIPESLFDTGVVDFASDCGGDLLCEASVVEVLMDGTVADSAYVRARDMNGMIEGAENWLQMDTVNKRTNFMNTGKMKIFFGAYSAEVEIKKD